MKWLLYQSGKPAHEGGPILKRGARVTLHHDLQVKEPFSQKTTMMSMKVHVSSLLPPIYRNFYLSVEKIKIFKHFDFAAPVKLCAPAGLGAFRRWNYFYKFQFPIGANSVSYTTKYSIFGQEFLLYQSALKLHFKYLPNLLQITEQWTFDLYLWIGRELLQTRRRLGSHRSIE